MGRLDTYTPRVNRDFVRQSQHLLVSSSAPEKIITYRLNEKLVYVTPAETYEQGVDYAKTVFPDELSYVQRKQITFLVGVGTSKGPRTVQIGPMAWHAVVSSLAKYEIIDIVVQPEVIVEDADENLPNYADATTDSKQQSSGSPSLLDVDAKSRSPSPSPSRKSPSPSRKEQARNWIKEHLP